MSGPMNMTDKIEDVHPTLEESAADRKFAEDSLKLQRFNTLAKCDDVHPTLEEALANQKFVEDSLKLNGPNAPAKEPRSLFDADSPRLVDPKESNKWFDAHFHVITNSGRTQVYKIKKDGTMEPYQNKTDFFDAYTHIKVNITSQDPLGSKTQKSPEAARYWFYHHPDRKTYHDTTFDPRGVAPPGTFNFWPGFGIAGAKNDDTEWKFVI